MNTKPEKQHNFSETNDMRTVELTKFLVSLPSTKLTALMLFIFCILFGLISSYLLFPNNLTNNKLAGSMANALFNLALPALLTTITIYIINRSLSFKRILFLSFIATIIYGLCYLFYLAFLSHFGLYPILIGFGLVFITWYVTARIFFGLDKGALLFAVIQLIFNSLFLLTNTYIPLEQNSSAVLIKIYFASFLFLAIIYYILIIINAPMKKTFGLASTDAITMFINQWFDKETTLETELERIGEEINSEVRFIKFKGKSLDLTLVIPYIHFGPFGNLGGSEFSYKIANELKELGNVMVFHGTATRDFNPVSSAELYKITEPIKNTTLTYKPAKGYISSSMIQNCNINCLEVNETTVMGLSQHPKSTEDIDYGLGKALINKAEQYISNSIIIDEHNSETGEISPITPGDKTFTVFEDLIGNTLEYHNKHHKLKVGYAEQINISLPCIGTAGVKVAMFNANKELVTIVLDSNGVRPEVKTTICDYFKKENRIVQVCTTDTHEINTVRGVLNPVMKNDLNQLIPIISQLIQQCETTSQNVKVGYGKSPIKIKVVGRKQTAEIVSIINTTMAIIKFGIPFVIIATLIMLLWALSMIE